MMPAKVALDVKFTNTLWKVPTAFIYVHVFVQQNYINYFSPYSFLCVFSGQEVNWICLFVSLILLSLLVFVFVFLIIKFCNQGLPLMVCVIVLLKRWVLVKLRHTKKRLMTTRCTCTSYKILSNDFLRTMTELSTAHSLNFCSCQGMPSQTNLFCQRLSQLSSDN